MYLKKCDVIALFYNYLRSSRINTLFPMQFRETFSTFRAGH